MALSTISKFLWHQRNKSSNFYATEGIYSSSKLFFVQVFGNATPNLISIYMVQTSKGIVSIVSSLWMCNLKKEASRLKMPAPPKKSRFNCFTSITNFDKLQSFVDHFRRFHLEFGNYYCSILPEVWYKSYNTVSKLHMRIRWKWYKCSNGKRALFSFKMGPSLFHP